MENKDKIVNPEAKRRKVDNEDQAPVNQVRNSPISIVTWNCNGFNKRCLCNLEEIQRLVSETQYPDLIAVQEVKLKQASTDRPDLLHPQDAKEVQPTLKGVFGDYTPFWSLADKRQAGTLTLVHQRLNFEAGNVAFSFQAAINLILRYFNLSRREVGLPQPAPSPQKQDKKKAKQTSMTSFFAAKKTSSSKSSTNPIVPGKHHSQGRFQFLMFPDRDVLQVYTPNNGHRKDSNQRRKEWDEEILNLLVTRKRILQKANQAERQLVWCGDLNCALEYRDGTHWERQTDGTVVEWWTDESKSIVNPEEKCEAGREAGDIGLASFTPNERRRLFHMLEQGDLVDAWRHVHPHNDEPKQETPSQEYWTRPLWTWRGHLSQQSFQARYEGKGQRVDYFLLSPSVDSKEMVKECEILGYGTERKGLFCGSDHCAMVLRLRDGSNETTQSTTSSAEKVNKKATASEDDLKKEQTG